MVEDKKAPEIRFEGLEEPWRKFTLGDAISIASRPIEMDDDTTYQCVTAKRRNEGIVSRGFFKGSDILVKSQYRIKSGDYIISKRQVVHGANGIVPDELDDAIVSNEYLVFQDSENMNVSFLAVVSKLHAMYRAFFLSSYGVHIEKLLFDFEDWKKRNIYLPKTNEQQMITSFFRTLDDTITLKNQQYEKTVNIKKAMLEKMFPRNGADVPEIRFEGFTKEWEVRKLGELADHIEYGLNAAAKGYDGTNKYLRITDIDDESREFLQTELTSPDINLESADNYMLRTGDVLFARTGASVGKTYRYRVQDGKVYFAGFLIRVRIKDDYNSEFVFQNTITSSYYRFIYLTSQRSGQPGVNAKEYSEFEIMMPCREEQAAIGNFFRNLDTLIEAQREELEKLQNIKKACLNKMFV